MNSTAECRTSDSAPAAEGFATSTGAPRRLSTLVCPRVLSIAASALGVSAGTRCTAWIVRTAAGADGWTARPAFVQTARSKACIARANDKAAKSRLSNLKKFLVEPPSGKHYSVTSSRQEVRRVPPGEGGIGVGGVFQVLSDMRTKLRTLPSLNLSSTGRVAKALPRETLTIPFAVDTADPVR